MTSQVMNNPDEIAKLFREQSQFPSLSRADIGPGITTQYGGKYSNIYTEWSQRDLERNEQVKFCRQYIVFHDDQSVVFSGPSGNCTEIKGVLLSRDSPSGDMKAVVRECTIKGEEKQFLEIWHKNSKVKSLNLTDLKKHGKVYEDDQFGCLVWSHSETHLLYVAEKKRPKAESFFKTESPESSPVGDEEERIKVGKKEEALKGDQFVYYEDWGETLVNKSTPVLCVLDIEGSNVSVLEGIPESISPGQAFWAPNDTGVVFVGWWHEPFRLGLRYCPNRRSSLFHVDLTSGKCDQLSDSSAVSSPRLSPDNCRIVYLECGVYGPHQQCSRLSMYDWYTKKTSVIVDVVKRPGEDGFTGIYSSMLSPMCWSADSQRVLISCAQRSHQELMVVDISTGGVSSLTSKSDMGSWSLLTVHKDLMVVSCSSPNCPPSLRVGFLPEKGPEVQVSWVTLETAEVQSDIDWKVLTFNPPPGQENDQYPGLDFEALLLKPKESKEGVKLPLIVIPHGGPHSVITADWLLSTAVFCKMGFALLLVNYRGSTGFGQDSIYSLPGKVGTQDVLDVQFAVESVLKQGCFDEQKVAISGGSHGGFLACHLIGQFPDFYKACIARNPVTNLTTMIGSTDIPDWCMVEAGLDYTPDAQLDPAAYGQMFDKSPIKHISQVKTPVLLTLGEDDKRVPPKQGIEYYRGLKARQIPVRLLWYQGNNHSLSTIAAESDGFMNIALWIIQHCGLKSDQ